jgi:hypothetical protein
MLNPHSCTSGIMIDWWPTQVQHARIVYPTRDNRALSQRSTIAHHERTHCAGKKQQNDQGIKEEVTKRKPDGTHIVHQSVKQSRPHFPQGMVKDMMTSLSPKFNTTTAGHGQTVMSLDSHATTQ